jgi:hypothetical protein
MNAHDLLENARRRKQAAQLAIEEHGENLERENDLAIWTHEVKELEKLEAKR